jgi:2-keto-3-deoxy-L-fuconate dehydrogenase
MTGRLAGRKVIITQADAFMGPALCDAFALENAVVHAFTGDPTYSRYCEDVLERCAQPDILVANLMVPNQRHDVTDIDDDEWRAAFDGMVHPLHRLVRAVLPQMIARRSGKIIVMGSANGMRGTAPRSAYSAARGAQLAYVRATGIEVAPHGINVNAIAQNFISNPTSYPPEKVNSVGFAQTLAQIPAGRVAESWESAALAVFLAGPESDFFHGQVFPLAGGWV